MDSNKLIPLLATYKGRDRFLRIFSYASKFAAGLSSSKVSPQLDILSKQLSSCRAGLRLLDDIPTLAYVIEYGLGKEDEDVCIRILNVLSNIVDVFFCPADHISWAIDHGILKLNGFFWDTLNTVLWVASLYINIIIATRKIGKLLQKKGDLLTAGKKDCDEMKQLKIELTNLTLSTVRSMLDVTFAVNYLPPGFLWSGSLAKWQVGALGTLSSAIALYQSLK